MLPRQLRQLQRHDNKTLNTVEAKCEWPTANVVVEIVQEWTKQNFKQKLVSADKKKKHMTRDDKKRGQE